MKIDGLKSLENANKFLRFHIDTDDEDIEVRERFVKAKQNGGMGK